MFKRNPFKIAIVAFFVVFFIDLLAKEHLMAHFQFWFPFVLGFIVVWGLPVTIGFIYLWKFLGRFDKENKQEVN